MGKEKDKAKGIPPRSNKWRQKVPYLKYAVHNVYNYTLLAGVGTTALLTQNWWLAVAGVGLEALWLLFAPDSRVLQRVWFDKVHDANLSEAATRARDRALAGLPEDAVARVRKLEARCATIHSLGSQNQAFAAELLRGELAKLDQLVTSFIDLLTLTLRQREYLATVDMEDLESDIRRYESILEGSGDGEVRSLAQKNLAVVMKRKEKLEEIFQVSIKAAGQMELIENTFELLADQIVTMRSPQELGGQLDDLIDGVEAVRSTAREAQSLMEAASR